ncbi:MAG: NAD(P)H-hydrate dehydratase [Ignavibacteria bacterium]|nr:NAD(P)H-hydrate dehydratase [Ignavibacteria bacterium]
MQTVAIANEMRWCDETTIRGYGIPGLLLMENAGRGVVQVIKECYAPIADQHIAIFCGRGNNGGDGFVIARHLINLGAIVTVVVLAQSKELKGDAKTNFDILKRLKKSTSKTLAIKPFSKSLLTSLPTPRLIVDAVFGTGFSGAVHRSALDVVNWINSQRVPVVAVDIPSGVDGTTGVVTNAAVKATHTVTFGLLKTGLLCNQGQDYAGKITVVDIGIPNAVRFSAKHKTRLVESSDIRSVLPERPSTAHKYSVGKVFILAGSKGFTGAAFLCASAALKAGTGAVILGTPESVYPILGRRLTETIVTPLPATAQGSISGAALDIIHEKLAWADVAVIGPGVSTNAETQDLLTTILRKYGGKMVLDADALRAVGWIGLKKLRRLKGSFVLTPHSGELARLVDIPSTEIEAHRISVARDAATASGATIVLKGGPTATGTSDGTVFLNSTGNPGMATVGSGDVLAGLIASLWAQGMKREAAAYSGVFLHGLAGDIAREEYGERSIVAQDLVDKLPAAIQRVEGPASV